MDRLIDNKRIEAWKNLEDESKKVEVPVLVNLETILSGAKNFISITPNDSFYSIAKSSIYLNSVGDPELIFVYNMGTVESKTKYTGYTPSSKEIGPFFVTVKRSNCLGYARKTINGLSIFYELISKPDNPEKVKSLYEVIKLLDENGILKQYLSNYSELITENCHDYIDILLKENELRSKQVVDKFYELIAKLK